jgi:hypothetical protein
MQGEDYMKVYLMVADANNYQNLIPIENDAFDIYREFNGLPLANPSVRLCVKILRDNERNKDLPKSDFPSLASHIPVFSKRAVSVLNELLIANGELVKMDCVDCEEPYFAFNVTTTVQALDLDHYELKRFESSGRIMRVIRYCFYPERLKGLTVFKLPELPLQNVFVTDPFV